MIRQIVNKIKESGCKVRLMNKTFSSGDTAAKFDIGVSGKPFISVGIKDMSDNDLVVVLLHEFGHYLQWETGFMSRLDSIQDSWGVLNSYTSGENICKKELKLARRLVLTLEYDACKRGIKILKDMDLSFDFKYYWDWAYSYNVALKATFATGRIEYNSMAHLNYGGKILTKKEVLAPLTKEEIIATGILGIKSLGRSRPLLLEI